MYAESCSRRNKRLLLLDELRQIIYFLNVFFFCPLPPYTKNTMIDRFSYRGKKKIRFLLISSTTETGRRKGRENGNRGKT